MDVKIIHFFQHMPTINTYPICIKIQNKIAENIFRGYILFISVYCGSLQPSCAMSGDRTTT